MSKFTFDEHNRIKTIVATLSLKRITDNEIIEFIFRQTNKTITVRSLTRIKQEIKRDSFSWYNTLRQDQFAYIHEFKERVNEITDLQKMHHEIIIRNRNNPQIQQTSLAELHKLNITLSNYVEIIPNVINGPSTVPTNTQDKTVSTEPEESELITV